MDEVEQCGEVGEYLWERGRKFSQTLITLQTDVRSGVQVFSKSEAVTVNNKWL